MLFNNKPTAQSPTTVHLIGIVIFVNALPSLVICNYFRFQTKISIDLSIYLIFPTSSSKKNLEFYNFHKTRFV